MAGLVLGPLKMASLKDTGQGAPTRPGPYSTASEEVHSERNLQTQVQKFARLAHALEERFYK